MEHAAGATTEGRGGLREVALAVWRLGGRSRWLRDVTDLLRLSFLVGMVVCLVAGPRVEALRLLLTFLVCLLPRLLATPAPFDFAFNAAMSLQAWGNVFNVFSTWLPYHDVVHCLLTMATALLFYFVLVRLRLMPDLHEETGIHQQLGMLLLVLAIGTFVGAVYEEYEWFAINVLGSTITEYYRHDIHDLLFNGLGSLIGGGLLVLWGRRHWTSRRPADGDPLPGLLHGLERRMERSASAEARARSRAGRRAHLDRGDRPPPNPHLSRLLAGDWTPVVRDVNDLFRLSLLAGTWIALAEGNWQSSLRFGLSFLASVAARWIDAPRLFDGLFSAALGFEAWGDFAGATYHVPGYLEWTFFAVTVAFAVMVYLGFVRFRIFPDFADEPGVHRRIAVFLAAMVLGYSVGVYYELYIWMANKWLGAHFPTSWDDLSRNLALEWAGAIAGAAVVVLWDVYGWGTRRRLPARRVTAGAVAG